MIGADTSKNFFNTNFRSSPQTCWFCKNLTSSITVGLH